MALNLLYQLTAQILRNVHEIGVVVVYQSVPNASSQRDFIARCPDADRGEVRSDVSDITTECGGDRAEIDHGS
jgi:hypothetical protein